VRVSVRLYQHIADRRSEEVSTPVLVIKVGKRRMDSIYGGVDLANGFIQYLQENSEKAIL
jgi:hypothetical protein